MRKGFTLIELLIVMAMLAALMGVSVSIFRVVLVSWSSGEARVGVNIPLDASVERMGRDIRESKQVTSLNNDEIRFEQQISGITYYYIYYLYNANNTYPPSFNQPSYELRKAAISGSLNGTFTYGSGQLIIGGILPPPASDLSISGGLVNIDLTARQGSETIRSKTQAKPRNT